MLIDFLKVLFDDGQKTCFAKTANGTKVRARNGHDLFFCINALHPSKDLVPCQPYHFSDRPRRADGNVVCYRNFLIEIDNMPLKEQLPYVSERIPFSTAVYSGGKSVHFIVSLEQALKTEEEYRQVAARLQKAVPNADASTKNPSRLSRLPYRFRPDTRKKQEALRIGERINNNLLLSQLPEIQLHVPSHCDAGFVDVAVLNAVAMPDITRSQLGMARNNFFYWLGRRLEDAGLYGTARKDKVLEAYNNLQDKSGFPQNEALTAARAL